MAIYRGPGGAGDATVDATNATAYVALKTQEATDAATAAAASAAEAAASAVIASTGLDGIAAYAASAAGSAASASDDAASAAISAEDAAISAANANEDAGTASTKANEASASADDAAASAASAANSANNLNTAVSSASASATAAAASASSAANSASDAAESASLAASAVVDDATPTVSGVVFGRTDAGTYAPPTTISYGGTVNETSYTIAADTNGDFLGDVSAVKNAITNNILQVGMPFTITCFNTVTNVYEALNCGTITALNNSGAGFVITFSNAVDFSNMQRATIFWYSKLLVQSISITGNVAENVTLGQNAGTGITTGGENVLLGAAAGNNVGSGRNNVVIGNAATASAQNVSNEVTLGNSSHTKTRLFGALAVGGSSTGTSGQILTSNGSGSAPSWTTAGTGTVTSVALSAPTGLTVSGSPVTTSGTLALSYTAGYSIPTDTKQTNWDTAYGWGNHASAGYLTGITSGQVTTALGYTPENAANKNAANGYAGLDSSGLVPSSILPSYVDDVLEYANLASFPGTGATGKIYVALDTNKIYRWSGSTYIEISASPGSTDAVTEGSTNLYFTDARARSAISASGSISYNSSTGVISYTQPTNVSTFTNDSGYITSSALSPYLTSSTAASTYAPLTGTGTSGTWGISITGNAATVTNGLYSTGSYSNPTWLTSISGSIVSGNISGNAANVTGTVAIANGGSGQTTAQAAMNAFAGAVTSGSYLRGNGTNVVMSTIQAADVPTLNQNTTGTAANVTGTVAVANGGTGSTTLTANNVLLGNGTSALQVVAPGTSGNVLTSNGTTWVSSAPSGGGSAATATALGTVYGRMTTSGASPYLTALGYNAGVSTTGVGNTAVGQAALQANTTSVYNTAVGYQAGYNNVTSDGYNAYLGWGAGYSTTSAYNTLIGAGAGYYITSGAKNTVVGRYSGNQGSLDIRTASNYIVLSDGDGNPRGIFDNNGRFMAGTTTQSNGQFGYATRITSYSTTESIMAITDNSSATGYYPLLVWQTATSGNNLLVGFYTEGGITLRGGIDYNRGAGQVRYNTTSDATLKNVIGDAPRQKSIDILNSTRIREYSWKNDPTNKAQIGVIAQELHETFKGAVSVGGEDTVVDDDGNEVTRYRPWAVDKTAFTFHLVAGFQHLFEQVQEQQVTIASQSALINQLTERITALEAK